MQAIIIRFVTLLVVFNLILQENSPLMVKILTVEISFPSCPRHFYSIFMASSSAIT
jgi:hypothetical protein